MPFDQLKKLVQAIHPLGREEVDDFIRVWQPFSANRKQQLTLAGQTENYLYFVVEGVQRVYYLDQQDREATRLFSYPPSFGGESIHSCCNSHPAITLKR